MLNLRPIMFVIGLVLSKLALFMYVPTLVAFFTGTGGFLDFAQAVIITHIAAFICLSIGRTSNFRLSVRDMFLITSLVWTIASAFAALPFVFINHISFTDAYFETMSGITTTGSTVLSGLDTMAPSILLWRSILQWLGGVGFIVMAVAVLPMLNVGGCACSKPNPPTGPIKAARALKLWRKILWRCIWCSPGCALLVTC